MPALKNNLDILEINVENSKQTIVTTIKNLIEASGYEIVELNDEKPWGAYFRMNSNQADDFVKEFFPGLNAHEARLGNDSAELSPKILLVSPDQRLSWQFHARRAERWSFLTNGYYNKSKTDEPGESVMMRPGDFIQFANGERHRLSGISEAYTIVAEIWQHTDSDNLSNEEDITHLSDDYGR